MAKTPLPRFPGFEVVSERTAWSGRFSVECITFRHQRFDGTRSEERTWELFRRGHAAALLPYDPWTDQVVLIEQFRLPALAAGVDPMMTEVPAGFRDGAETAEQAARRETQEEMGLSPDLVTPMLDVVLTPGGSDERCSLFAGRVHAPAAGAGGIAGRFGLVDEHEDIRVMVIPANIAIEAAADGRYANSVTTLALLWLGLRKDRLRAGWAA